MAKAWLLAVMKKSYTDFISVPGVSVKKPILFYNDVKKAKFKQVLQMQQPQLQQPPAAMQVG